MSALVFISYASVNHDLAQTIRDDLESDGFACWMASRDILGSTDYIKVIPPAIESAKVFLLVLSAAAMASDHVYREVHTAADAKLPILPIRVDDTKLDGPLKFVLAGAQWVDAAPRVEPALDRIRSEVRRLLEQGGVPVTLLRPSRFQRAIATAVAWLLVSVLTVLAGLLIHGYWFNLVPRSMFPQVAAQNPVPLLLLLATPLLALGLQYSAHRNLRDVLSLDALFAVGQGKTPLFRTTAALSIGIALFWAVWRIPATVTLTPELNPIEQFSESVAKVHDCNREGFVESKGYAVRLRVGAYNPRSDALRVEVQYQDPDSLEFCAVWADRRFGLKENGLEPGRDDRLPQQRSKFFEIRSSGDGFTGARLVLFTLIRPSSATLGEKASARAAVVLGGFPPVQSATRSITEDDWK